MADRNQKILDMVEKEIEKDPAIKADQLFEKARKLDKSVGDLNLRQFHARYALPIKRRRAVEKGGARRPTARTRTSKSARRKVESREAVRRVFLDFASALAGAETPGAIVDVLAKVDEYVDDAIKKVR